MAQKKKVRVKGGKKKNAPAVTVVVQEDPASRAKKDRTRRRRSRVQAIRQGAPRAPGLKLSHCASKYAAAVARPFSAEANGCCLPYPPDRDSLKATAYLRFPVTADASGNFFVLVAPCLANDMKAVWYNNVSGTVPMSVVTLNVAPANYGALAFTTQPFAATLLNSGQVSGRVVSVGIRMTYTGTAANMAGYFYSYSDPEHNNLNAADFGSSTVVGALETKIRRVSNEPYEQGFTVVKPGEHEYVGINEARFAMVSTGAWNVVRACYPWSMLDINNNGQSAAAYVPNGGAPIIFGAVGTQPSSTFFIEIVQHAEFVGKSASWGLTPSHNDHNAANIITAAADRSQGDFVGRPEDTWSATFTRNFRRIWGGMDEMGGEFAGMAVRAGMRQLAMRQRGALLLQ